MVRIVCLVGAAAFAALTAVGSPGEGREPTLADAARPAELSFNEHIQPILAENCYACHGADASSRKAELRLDVREAALAPRKDGGAAIVPGNPDESPLVRRIESSDERKRMPPPEAHKTLTTAEIAALRQWIAEGAEYQAHWAFIAPTRPPLPDVGAHSSAIRNPVDAYIIARLQEERLAPSAEADRYLLIRRVTLDLTGLPPTPAEVEAFASDRSPTAYQRVVDRLLASPRFGEHRARYWLDYVRYADTTGIHIDNYRAIWPYRDYIIRAFNTNKPFDRFVREQLAGDLLPARTLEELAATGFMRCNLTTNESGTVEEEVVVNRARDRVEAFGATFLGLTTGCAACHDHKFDPITQRDFYGLAAYLGNTTEEPWDRKDPAPPPILRLAEDESRPAAEAVLAYRAEIQQKLQQRRSRARELAGAWLVENKPNPVGTDALELRLRLDEGAGDVVHNTAPGADTKTFKADTNPLVWGANTWLWPAMRMDIRTRLNLGGQGNAEAGDEFSAGGWVLFRAKPGGAPRLGTSPGPILARMGGAERRGGAGWELFKEATQIAVNLVAQGGSSAMHHAVAAAELDVADDDDDETPAPGPAVKASTAGVAAAKRAIQVVTKTTLDHDQWMHVFFTYDGSRKASGVKIYINGKPVDTEVRLDALGPGDSIRTDAAMHLGRRDDFMPLREPRFQDVRFYRRLLAPDEVARLPFEDVASEIVARQPDPAKWTTDEAFVVADRFYIGEHDATAKALTVALAAHDAALQALTREGAPTLIAQEKTTPAYADILDRGDYHARRERVGPATPGFLPPPPAGAPPDRRGLADWLLSAEHPLFARVTVNRAWQEIFGRGLVETADDLGVMGARPSHPQLLDWLAVEFRESGWNVKHLYRLLVTSATYRQTVAVTAERFARDPDNRLLSRGPRFRLDGEILRDSALAASGLLVEKIGGPSVKPYQPPGLWEAVTMPQSDTKTYIVDQGEGLYRRSVYTFWKRSSPPPSMETFDATAREIVCSSRARSNTPLQAFVTMNDPQWVEAARKLAERALHAAADDAGRVRFIASVTLGRQLDSEETSMVLASSARYRGHFVDRADAAKELLSVGDAPVDPALEPVDVAQWTFVASQFFNLDEFLTK